MTTTVQVVRAMEKVDPDAARELVRLAAYETLADLCEDNRAEITKSIVQQTMQTNTVVRRELIRKFVDARLAQVDVTPLLQAAGHLTLVDYEIGKAAGDHEDDPETPYWDKRKKGAFAPRVERGIDLVDRFTSQREQSSRVKGRGDQLMTTDRHGQLRTLGRGLQSLNHPGAKAAGVAMELTGQLGPEAEAVFSNHLKRAAYRYRGTERNADPQLKTVMTASDNLTAQLTSPDPEHAAAGLKVLEQYTEAPNRPGGQSVRPPAVAIAELNAKKYRSNREQALMATRADVATQYLLGKVPSMRNAQLSMQAGKTPPSQGVLIDADGEVVSQAVGYNGDHYLPFDLKNLKDLHGGQYVRTRVMGGPTTEDLYTGLMTGARRMTVVSNTGVFTVEFDPDLRGGRRYSDKARQMVSRYSAMLETIAGGEAVTGQLSQEELSELRTQALEETNYNVAQAKTRFNELRDNAVKEKLFFSEDEDFSGESMQLSQAEARSNLNRGVATGTSRSQVLQRASELEGERKKEAFDNELRALKLNAAGYKQAMDSLKEEFPFFIRDVDYVPLERWQSQRSIADRTGSVVRPGVPGTDQGFVGAKELSYGQAKRVPQRRATGAAAAEGEKAKTEDKTETSTSTGGEKAAAWGKDMPRVFQHEAQQVQERLARVKASFQEPSVEFEQASKQSKNTLADVATLPQLVWWLSYGRDVVKGFTEADAATQDHVLSLLADAEAVEDEAKAPVTELHATLTKIAPFAPAPGQGDDVLVAWEPGKRPYAWPEITKVGRDAQALERMVAKGGSANGKLVAAVQKMDGLAEPEREQLVAQASQEALNAEEGSPQQAELEAEALDLHRALTWHRAHELAVEMAPKAPARRRPGQPLQPSGPVEGKAEKRFSSPDAWQVLSRAFRLIDESS